MMHARVLVVAAAAAMTSIGCGREAEQPASARSPGLRPNVVTVTVSDYSFQAPDSVPAGLTMIQALMRGEVPHHVNIVRLDSAKTAADYVNALTPSAPPPAWATPVGGPNPTENGTTANAMLVLEPGNYALICFVDTPDKVPHFAKGMVHAFTVTPSTARAMAPTATVNLELVDYAFNFDKPLTAGRHTMKVTNPAPQDHEIQIVQLAPGKTPADLQKWVETMQGPPPGKAIGGVASMKPGTTNYFDVELTPGEYVALCFVPDHKDGKPHHVHGMVKPFTVS